MAPGQIRDTAVSSRQLRQDAPPGGIRQRGEGAIKCPRMIFNHLVNYLACTITAANKIFAAPPIRSNPTSAGNA